MRKKLLIVAAPFGYGPAARALLLARGLADTADVTILSFGDAYRFIDRFKPGAVACREGGFRAAFPRAAELAPFTLVVSVNNEPAVHHLIELDLAARTVFVDSILPWRAAHSPITFAAPLCAYLVQDFPGVEASLAACHAHIVERVAPMVWSGAGAGGAGGAGASRQPPLGHVTLHLGGVTSPLVTWAMLRQPIEQIFLRTHELTRRFGRRLSVIGSRHLATLTPANADDVVIRADISPPETAELLGQSELLLSTPGIGAIFEAMTGGVPTLVLPPMNSTQLLQYGVFTDRGLPGAMSDSVAAGMRQQAAALPWGQQTAYCIEFLHRHLADSLAEVPRHLERLWSPGGETLRHQTASAGTAFMGGLSRASAITIIRRLLTNPGPPRR